MLEELNDELDLIDCISLGLLTYGELVQLFHRSDLHCYFTRPYVVSWGVYQAAACGARLLVNNFPGMDEVFADGPEFPPVDLDDQDNVTASVVELLGRSYSRSNRVSSLAAGLDFASTMDQWFGLVDALCARSAALKAFLQAYQDEAWLRKFYARIHCRSVCELLLALELILEYINFRLNVLWVSCMFCH